MQCIAQWILFSLIADIKNAGCLTSATPVTRDLAHNAGTIVITRCVSGSVACRSNMHSSPRPTATALYPAAKFVASLTIWH
uniref:Uncharacterized protein n=1 Tax=Ralstonia solanacearum TaxID=305 RepID=A0A0S4UPN7_RALSL|nr:protein of unknown function [Ralstonia solanacearum]CUV37356.1 protein of unknown function [Ralstonia solanacearum]CUV41703.1 protein of unknown function [Ralstonia solanacearum]CUV60095.1 protein of unknown function [Ralstonia solanacearum]